jgi:peroxin-10
VLLPYLFARLLPRLRTTLRKRLQARLASLTRQGRDETKSGQPSTEYRALRYLHTHLASLTSGAHLHAATLAVFYFSGAYYSLSKRLFGLRYVFTRRIEDGQGGRAGYEVLGVLLVVQMLVRGYSHIREQLASAAVVPDEEDDHDSEFRHERGGVLGTGATVDVSLDGNAYTINNELLGGGGGASGGPSSAQRSLAEIGRTAHTPVPKAGRARYDLGTGDQVMGWIKGVQQRKCTLCLEELKDPAATSCGHVFCWACIGDWVREKPECPLCRREALVQHILPLRVA